MPLRLIAFSLLALPACSTPSTPSSIDLAGASSAPSFMASTSDAVDGTACAFSADQWSESPLLNDRLRELGGVSLDGQTVTELEVLQERLRSDDAFTRQQAAMAINLAFDGANIFGIYSDFAGAIIVDGPYAGQTAASLHVLGEREAGDALARGMDLLNSGFADCIDEWYLTDSGDLDGDGVPSEEDCDDGDVRVGRLLLHDDLSEDVGYFDTTPQKDDPWSWNGTSAVATEPGQQVLLGDVESWTDIVVFAEFTSQGSKAGCGFDCLEQCGEYVPERSCWASWEAVARDILEVETTDSGVATFSNTDSEYDICLEAFTMFDADGSQGLALGDDSGDEYRIPAGGSIDVHYGSWTMANGVWEPYLGEADLWCYQNGTSLKTGVDYHTIGAVLPTAIQDILTGGNDTDADGVDDLVDWVDSAGVQAQYDIWDYQDDHALVVVGKSAESNTAGGVDLSMTVQNRGALSASATLSDSIPANWSLVSCDSDPDSTVANPDGSTTHSWSLNLDGCSDNCSTIDTVEIACEIAYALNVDMDIVELDRASVAYHDGDDDQVSVSYPAVAFDYDWDADGELLCGETDRWRAGILARAALDADQDEGYHGYRCALSSNSSRDCYDGGHFLQLAEFMDAEEDDLQSECQEGVCDNPTFDQLARSNHEDDLDIRDGDVASLEFWLVDEGMYCKAEGEGQTVEASASALNFSEGSVGMSTLNMFGDYDWLSVCEAYSLPSDGEVEIQE